MQQQTLDLVSGWITVVMAVLSLPGLISIWSDTLRRRLRDRTWVPVVLVGLTVVAILLDVGARSGLLVSDQLTVHENQTFTGDVNVDGNSYFGCVFNNVRFVYRGGPYSFFNSRYVGHVNFLAATRSVSNTLTLLEDLHLMTPAVVPELVPGQDLPKQ